MAMEMAKAKACHDVCFFSVCLRAFVCICHVILCAKFLKKYWCLDIKGGKYVNQ